MRCIIQNLVLRARRFGEIDLEQYNETRTIFDLFNSDSAKQLYEHYFKYAIIGIKRFYEYCEIIKKKYNIVIYDCYPYFSKYISELYDHLHDKNDITCLRALEQLNLSGEPSLVEIYNKIMERRKTR